MNERTDLTDRAAAYISGEALTLTQAKALWKELQKCNQISTARAVLAHTREEGSLLDPLALTGPVRDELIQKEAMLTSKDPELSSATRHDQALALLSQEFDLNEPSFTDSE